jgi:hypothetical protein
MNLLNLKKWRRQGTIKLNREVLKKTYPTKQSANRQFPRESRHRLKLFRPDKYFDLMEIHGHFRPADNPIQHIRNTVLKSLDAERMADTRME